MADSLKASQQGLQIIEQAQLKKGWTKDASVWQDEAENVSRSTLQRFWKQTPIRQASFVAICKAVGIEDWEKIVDWPSTSPSPESPSFSVYNAQTWVGRSQLIDEILPKLQDKTRAVWITGIPGIGKTTLGECLASCAWDTNPSFQWVYLEVLEGQGADFTTIAAELLSKLGETNLDPQERNDPKRLTDRLIRKLQANFYWVQLDSLERLLDSEQGTSFADEYWVTFLQRCLTEPQFCSRLVLTAQALPSGLVEFADRYSNFWQARTLSGLAVDDQRNEHLEFFDKHGARVNEANRETLCKLGQVYEGHTLVLQVMSGEIQADYGGDAARYWAVNQQEFEQVARSLDSKRLDETEYNDELDRRVRERVKKSLQQLPTDAQDLLLRSSVYRRPVPKKFWLAMIDDRSSSQQKEAYRVLCDRALVEKEGANIRQHNLIRAVVYDMLQLNHLTWQKAEYQAVTLWLTAHKPSPNSPKIESVRGSLEAFYHYCEIGNWNAAKAILLDQELGLQLQTWGNYREVIIESKQIINQLAIEDEIVCTKRLGSSYYFLGQYFQAIRCQERSLSLARQIGNRIDEGPALRNLGLTYNAMGQYERALSFLETSLKLSLEINDCQGERVSLVNLGLTYNNLGLHRKAIDVYEKALLMAKELSTRHGEGNALCGLGNAYHCLGQYESAIDFNEQYLKITQEIGDRRGEGNALGNLGLSYRNLGFHQRAINFHEQHLKITQEIGDRAGEGNVLGDLGRVLHILEQYTQAINFHQQYLKIAQEIGNRQGEGIALTNLGATQFKLAKYTESLTNTQTALEIFREIGDRATEAEALKNLAELHQALGEVEVAQQYCQQALALAIELGIPLAEECRKLQEEIEANLSIASG